MELVIKKNFKSEEGKDTELFYKLLQEDGFGVEITSKTSEETESSKALSISQNEVEAVKIISMLADNLVTPVTMKDILYDYSYQKLY